MKNDAQIALRLPSTLLEEIDALVSRLSQDGLQITRADTLRMLVIRGLRYSKTEKG